jgi:hypothetical protein
MVPSFAGILFCVILSVLQDLREFHDDEEEDEDDEGSCFCLNCSSETL